MSTCLLDRNAQLHLFGGRLTVSQPDRAAQHLPLHSLTRVVMRAPSDPAVQALMLLAKAGRPVHFIDSHGAPIATLHPHQPSSASQTPGERLALALLDTHGTARYQNWLDNQRSHTCSRVMRYSRSRDWTRVEHAVQRYMNQALQRPSVVNSLQRELRGLLWAWLDARFQNLGLYDPAEVLEGRGCHLQQDLETLLALPLRGWITPVLREHPNAALDAGRLFHQQEPALESRLWLHLNALQHSLRQGSKLNRAN